MGILQRLRGRFVRPKWNHGGIGNKSRRLPRLYSKIGALLKSPGDGGTSMLRLSAGEKGSLVQKKVQRKARASAAWAPGGGGWGAAFEAAEALVWQLEGGEHALIGFTPTLTHPGALQTRARPCLLYRH